MPIISQSRANAGGDIVAGNKITNIIQQSQVGVVAALLSRLQDEVDRNIHARHMVDTLARYHSQRSLDGVVGLEAKLRKAGREAELYLALEQKEQFAKLLEQWSLYASAQHIFAHLLARAEFQFNHIIMPQIGDLSIVATNELVHDRVVAPTVLDCGSSVFAIDHGTAMGMVYWLAEQCYVRWHQ